MEPADTHVDSSERMAKVALSVLAASMVLVMLACAVWLLAVAL